MQRSKARYLVDALLACALTGIMASAVVVETAHEWLGITLLVLIAAHLAQHRKQLAALAKGSWNRRRVVSAVLLAGALLCTLAQMGSALVISKYAFAWLPPLAGSALARQVHMTCSHWAFVSMMLHAGYQASPALVRTTKGKLSSTGSKAVVAIILLAVAASAIWSASQLSFISYLLLQVAFAPVDYSKPITLAFAQYASLTLALFALGAALSAVIGATRKGSH